MSKGDLIAHLINDHKLAFNSDNTFFKAIRKRARPVLGEKNINKVVYSINTSTRTMSKEAKSVD
ncbi:hypothetical protein OIDMADRAFT_19499 [Oidiodendron maius Zn]|uniref:Uncharacterized protein n=1 Tax=Oidiodendron maius (strain Zn) TaxID=913774 RepID=A0A0C3GWD6_OIDMZ|nr:hypothetical protein OIDMADRAFT_19499 [Oidiodendron maius Zn]